MDEPCQHLIAQDPATRWPDEDALDHFDHCLKPQQRLEYWQQVRRQAEDGIRCWTMAHEVRIDQLEARIRR
jgi:hypothetical protein